MQVSELIKSKIFLCDSLGNVPVPGASLRIVCEEKLLSLAGFAAFVLEQCGQERLSLTAFQLNLLEGGLDSNLQGDQDCALSNFGLAYSLRRRDCSMIYCFSWSIISAAELDFRYIRYNVSFIDVHTGPHYVHPLRSPSIFCTLRCTLRCRNQLWRCSGWYLSGK